MVLVFLLGWPLEWVPIVLIIVPILLPVVETLDFGLDRTELLVWFAILVAVNLQTAWLSPPVAVRCQACARIRLAAPGRRRRRRCFAPRFRCS